MLFENYGQFFPTSFFDNNTHTTQEDLVLLGRVFFEHPPHDEDRDTTILMLDEDVVPTLVATMSTLSSSLAP